jgi:hypothetical protein
MSKETTAQEKRFAYSFSMRDVDSARTSTHRRVDGRLEARIAHAPLHGVTSEMLVWWFENFADEPTAREDDLSTRKTARVGDQDVPLYWLWHPIDHFMVRLRKPSPTGAPGLSEGAQATLKERILDVIEVNALVDGMSRDGIHLTMIRGPFRLGDLRHTFADTPEGLVYRSRLIVGSTLPLIGRLVNFIARRFLFTPATLKRWLRHNVEEVGNFEHFLSGLYQQRAEKTFHLTL